MTKHSVTCKKCNETVQGELYHLGFSDMDCMYCDSCPRALLLKDHTLAQRCGIEWPNLQPGDKGWEYYNRHLLPVYARFEALFLPCECGGTYRAGAPPRCPKCNEYLGDGVPDFDKPSTWLKGHVFVTAGAVTDRDHLRELAPNHSLQARRP